jgi:membrane-associated phospholipid phosphatase
VNSRLATVLSVLFHPLLLPTYLFVLLLYYLPPEVFAYPPAGRRLIVVLVFILTFLLPVFGTLLLQQAGVVASLTLDARTDRRWPLAVAAVCYTVLTVLFFRMPFFDYLFWMVMAVITASVYLTLVINQFWKISAHSIGLGGVLGLLVLLHNWLPETYLLYPVLVVLVISGAVISARLALGAHTIKQVYTGFFLGFLLGISLWGVAL